jgi:hypothetical protein
MTAPPAKARRSGIGVIPPAPRPDLVPWRPGDLPVNPHSLELPGRRFLERSDRRPEWDTRHVVTDPSSGAVSTEETGPTLYAFHHIAVFVTGHGRRPARPPGRQGRRQPMSRPVARGGYPARLPYESTDGA